jgi:hypothetical protein
VNSEAQDDLAGLERWAAARAVVDIRGHLDDEPAGWSRADNLDQTNETFRIGLHHIGAC